MVAAASCWNKQQSDFIRMIQTDAKQHHFAPQLIRVHTQNVFLSLLVFTLSHFSLYFFKGHNKIHTHFTANRRGNHDEEESSSSSTQNITGTKQTKSHTLPPHLCQLHSELCPEARAGCLWPCCWWSDSEYSRESRDSFPSPWPANKHWGIRPHTGGIGRWSCCTGPERVWRTMTLTVL